MYWSLPSVFPSVPRRIPRLPHEPGCNLGEWQGVPCSYALLGGFAIGARVSLLRPLCTERKMSASACTLLYPWFAVVIVFINIINVTYAECVVA